jgi:23S rRNA pseudouridine1911/1915/1917 synthase
MKPEVIKEAPDYLILNKPAGLVVHADGRTDEGTLCDWVVENYPEVSGVGEPLVLAEGTKIDRPGIVHRLDRDTSGVIIVARTQAAFEYLKKKFQDRDVEKKYHAFVYGNITEDNFAVDEPIGRSKKDFRRWFSGKDTGIRGKTRDALTEFKVLARSDDKKTTLIEASPKTGRTHQIRVHLKSIYNPILGDSLYAPDRESLLGFARTALHARSIKFMDQEGKEVFVEAPYTEDFSFAIKTIKNEI